MKRILIFASILIFLAGCAAQQKNNCGTKAQKKAKHNSMKSGRGMLH